MQKKTCLNAIRMMTVGVCLWGSVAQITSFARASSAEVMLKGNLLDYPPCELHTLEGGKGAPIVIGFNEVAIQRINGKNYRKDWTLVVTCDGAQGDSVAISLRYNGSKTDFDAQALVSDQSELGVRLYRASGGDVVHLNTLMTLNLSGGQSQSIPLYAVPVKATNATLKSGSFKATAEFEVNYP